MITITRVKQAANTFIKVLRYGKDDVQTSEPVLPHGIDSKPVKEDLAVHSDTSNSDTTVILGYIKKFTNTKTGETRIYSTDEDGAEQFEILLTDDGDCIFNGGSDNAVRYSELNIAFNELKEDFNSLVLTYRGHIHITTATVGPTAVPGVIAPTTSGGTESTANIALAKIGEILVP